MSRFLEIALSQYGIKEIEGSNHNKTILDYAAEAGFSWVNDDETPWCSIFMNWAAKRAGLQFSGKANARSWLKVGTQVTTPQTGDIVILKRGLNPLSGHVGIFINYDETGRFIHVLGGNQGNTVKVSLFDKNEILGFRTI